MKGQGYPPLACTGVPFPPLPPSLAPHLRHHVVGPEVLDAVQVAEVHGVAVGGGAVAAVLLHVHDKQAHIHTLNVLRREGDGMCVCAGRGKRGVWRISVPQV